MNFKFYENSWTPAIKGVFYFIFGLFAIVQTGTFETLSIFFDVLILLIAILYFAIGFLSKGIKNKYWTIFTGLVHLGFGVWLSLHYGGDRLSLFWITILWIIFSGITDLVESILVFRAKNVLGALFLINAILTFVFAYFTIKLISVFTPGLLESLGIMAITIGLVSECVAYILSKSRTLPE